MTIYEKLGQRSRPCAVGRLGTIGRRCLFLRRCLSFIFQGHRAEALTGLLRRASKGHVFGETVKPLPECPFF